MEEDFMIERYLKIGVRIMKGEVKEKCKGELRRRVREGKIQILT